MSMKIYIYSHTHWDREWYRTFQQYRLRLIEIIDIILEEFDKNELEYFTLDGQAIVLEDYLEARPENKDRLLKHINNGRLEIGPWYVLPDEFLVSGESLVENLYLGHKLCSQFGETNKIGYLPDTFGHSIDIPVILNNFNIDNAILWRGINTNNTEFLWYSMDKSKVKTFHLLEGYYNVILQDNKLSIDEKLKAMQDFINKIRVKTTLDYLLVPMGGDHMPPPINLRYQLNELNSLQNEYEFVQCRLKDFLNHINTDELKEHVQQEFRDCSKSYILPGVYSSRLYLKQANSRLTHKINSIIEPLSCYCNLLGLNNFQLPDSEYLWKMLITNHPHDSICGCSIDQVHEEMEQRFRSLDQACNEIINRAKYSIMQLTTPDEITVFNSSNYSYSGPVNLIGYQEVNQELTQQTIKEFEDHYFEFYSDINEPLPATIIKKQTEKLLWIDNIPPHSFKTIKPVDIPNIVHAQNNTLSNGLIEIQINKDSINIKDLQNNREYTDFNQIVSRLDRGDSYNFGPVKFDQPVKASIIAHRIEETGPIRGSINITYEINIPESLNEARNGASSKVIKHTIECILSITANSKLVEFNLCWENKSKDHLLQVIFPQNNDIYTTLSENHFSALERRFDPEYNIYDHVPAKENTELKNNTAPMQRFVQACDIALFTEGLPEYEVFKNNLKLTILRSTGYLSREDIPSRGVQAGPKLETGDNQCIRKCYARYAIHPKSSIPDLYKLAEIFMGNTICIQGSKETSKSQLLDQKLVKWENPNIIATRFKQHKDKSKMILHLLNISSYPQNVILSSDLAIMECNETDFLNKPINKINLNQPLTFRAHELKSVEINLHKKEPDKLILALKKITSQK